jgi:hypothetical protein
VSFLAHQAECEEPQCGGLPRPARSGQKQITGAASAFARVVGGP